MKRFLVSIVVSAIFVWIVMLTCDFLLSNRLARSADRRYIVWNEILQGGINSDVLIMGSSRAWVQYSTCILDSILHCNSYNLGIDGSAFDRQLMRYDVYRIKNEKPRVVIQNIDFMSTLGITNGYEREQFFPFLCNREFRNVIKNESFSIVEKYLPFGRYYGYYEILEPALFFANDTLYKGFRANDKKWLGYVTPNKPFYFRSDKCTEKLFVDYVRRLSENDIRLIFVYAPVYYKAINDLANIDDMYHKFDSIAELFDVPILDYTFSAISYDTTYFYNASHLNKRGSELFTTMLAYDLDSLNICP